MKITGALSFIRESDIPEVTRNTESAKTLQLIIDKIKAAPAGQGVAVPVSGAQKFHRYSMQQRLQKAGMRVTVVLKGNQMLIKKVTEDKKEK